MTDPQASSENRDSLSPESKEASDKFIEKLIVEQSQPITISHLQLYALAASAIETADLHLIKAPASRAAQTAKQRGEEVLKTLSEGGDFWTSEDRTSDS